MMFNLRFLVTISIRVVLIIALLFASAMFVMAQDDSEPDPIPDLTDEIVFVEGDSALDNFTNNILNNLRVLFLSYAAPALGFIVMGTGLIKRLVPKKRLPDNFGSEEIAFTVLAVVFGFYFVAGRLEQTENLQQIVDLVTELGNVLLLGTGTGIVASKVHESANRNNVPIAGFKRHSNTANG